MYRVPEEKKILVTGFEAFGNDPTNPSSMAVGMLPEKAAGAVIIKKTLPVIFGKAADMLIETIRLHPPDGVICTGLAGGRKGITPELVAVNLRHARIPDNAQFKPVWEKILPEGEDGLFSSLPIRDMTDGLASLGIPAEISTSAGTFVCNEVMYRLLSFCKIERPGMIAGFIHVPYASEYLPEGKDAFCMPIRQIADSLEVCIRILAKNLPPKGTLSFAKEEGADDTT